MKFNSVKRGNFSGLAGHVNRTMDQSFEAGRSTSVDHTNIAKESIKGRSLERRAVMKAEADVSRAGLQALGKTKETRDSVDAEEKIEGYKRPARRMAGVLGGLGTLAMTGAMYKAEQKARKEESDARLEADQRRAEWEQDMLTALTNRDTGVDVEPFVPGTPPSRRSGGDSGSNSSGNSASASLKLTPGKPITQAQGTQLLIDQGMDSENARIGGAVMMAESDGRPGALNSTNEYSLGLWQHNRDTGEDRRNFYGISDWSELSDPVTNARATYRLWKRQGGWEPWGAFTNGSYRNFL